MWQAYALAFLCLLAFLFVSRRNGSSATPVGAPLEDALSMLNHPAGVAIPLRYGYGLRAPAAGEYSRWHCVGGLEDVGETEHRTCVFNHVRRTPRVPTQPCEAAAARPSVLPPRLQVCYDAADADFLFYARVANRTAPVIYDHRRGVRRRFRERRADGDPDDADFVALAKSSQGKKGPVTWSPRVVVGPRPPRAKVLPGLHALSAPFVSTNLGHVAWDEGFPLVVAMAQLGLYTPRLHLLRTSGCDALASESSRAICVKFESAFLAPLTGDASKPPQTLLGLAAAHGLKARGGGALAAATIDGDSSSSGSSAVAAAPSSDGSSLLCFEKLLVGGSFDAFNSEALNVGKEALLALYRSRVLRWHGIDPGIVPKEHQILLVNKHGKRAIHNFGKVRMALKERFVTNVGAPWFGDGIYKDTLASGTPKANLVVTSFASMTMAEQLKMLAETTVAVSPYYGASLEQRTPLSRLAPACPHPLPRRRRCGGVSMILPFLPEGSYAILINYMLHPEEPARHGECHNCSWTMEAELWRHVRHVRKMYYQVWGPQDFARGRPGRNAAVKVDPQRLGDMVETAIHEMEPF